MDITKDHPAFEAQRKAVAAGKEADKVYRVDGHRWLMAMAAEDFWTAVEFESLGDVSTARHREHQGMNYINRILTHEE